LPVLLILAFSAGCEESRAAEARPCDIAASVAEELGMRGVLLSDIGIREAYVRASELVGELDGLNGWAVFLPYTSAGSLKTSGMAKGSAGRTSIPTQSGNGAYGYGSFAGNSTAVGGFVVNSATTSGDFVGNSTTTSGGFVGNNTTTSGGFAANSATTSGDFAANNTTTSGSFAVNSATTSGGFAVNSATASGDFAVNSATANGSFVGNNTTTSGSFAVNTKTTSARHFSTHFRTAVENAVESADSEFGILLTHGGSSYDSKRLGALEKRIKERLGKAAEVRQCGNFILYGMPNVLDAATSHLYTVD